MTATFGWRPALLALAVVAVWGTNFVVIKYALHSLPPFLFATLRFAFVVTPAVLLLPRPKVPWRDLAAYGVLIGVGQFAVIYFAINGHIAPGLASLLVQTQIFFTIALAQRGNPVRLHPSLWVALALAGTGIGIIAGHTGGSTTPLGVLLVLVAACGWAGGNIVQRRARGVDMLGYVVWSSLFAVPPLLALSLIFEGPALIASSLAAATTATWAAVVWQAVGNTMFGYAVWGWLLGRYPTTTVAPLTLLVPVFGMGASALLLAEPLETWKLLAATLVIGGLAVNLLGPRLWRRFEVTPGA